MHNINMKYEHYLHGPNANFTSYQKGVYNASEICTNYVQYTMKKQG